MEYRLMTIEDYDKIYALWMSCKNMGFNDKDDSYEGIDAFLKRNPTTNFVATCDNHIVGVILCGNDGRRGFIHHMAVSESYRRQGIASKLVSLGLSALKECGITKVALLVFERNKDGNAFWEKMGFTARHDIIYRNQALVELTRIDT